MENNHSLKDVFDGVLFLYSETGTEGGYWAFQDSCYIQKNVPRGYCKKCGFYMREQNGLLIKKKSANGKHKEEIGDAWDYEGLHILENGDNLTIYHPDNHKEVWSGIINLKQYTLFTEQASGMWIHADQIGIERDVWAEYFLKKYSAKLIHIVEDKNK